MNTLKKFDVVVVKLKKYPFGKC